MLWERTRNHSSGSIYSLFSYIYFRACSSGTDRGLLVDNEWRRFQWNFSDDELSQVTARSHIIHVSARIRISNSGNLWAAINKLLLFNNIATIFLLFFQLFLLFYCFFYENGRLTPEQLGGKPKIIETKIWIVTESEKVNLHLTRRSS